MLAIDEEIGNDPGHRAAVLDDRFGERSHQPD
jgi:hypothetical protein